VVGVDTGLTHFAGALGAPTVGIYTHTDPAATGLYGCARAANVGGMGKRPQAEEVARVLRQVSG
jgi:heptosyltransferase I